MSEGRYGGIHWQICTSNKFPLQNRMKFVDWEGIPEEIKKEAGSGLFNFLILEIISESPIIIHTKKGLLEVNEENKCKPHVALGPWGMVLCVSPDPLKREAIRTGEINYISIDSNELSPEHIEALVETLKDCIKDVGCPFKVNAGAGDEEGRVFLMKRNANDTSEGVL